MSNLSKTNKINLRGRIKFVLAFILAAVMLPTAIITGAEALPIDESATISSASLLIASGSTGTMVITLSKEQQITNPQLYIDNGSLSVVGGTSGLTEITNKVSFIIEAASGLAAGTDIFNISLSYDESASPLTGQCQLIILGEAKAPSSTLDISSVTLSNGTIASGGSTNIDIKLSNKGNVVTDTMVSIDGLSADTISIIGSTNTVLVRNTDTVTFKLAAKAGLAAGSYPITINLSYIDLSGAQKMFAHQYFVNVSGSSVSHTNRAWLEIVNVKGPSSTVNSNDNFAVEFELKNSGELAASDITVTVKGQDGVIIPKSLAIQRLATLEKGKTSKFKFTLSATSESITQNYPLEIKVTYNDGTAEAVEGTLTTAMQYVGVNVKNDKSDKGGATINEPKIIVSRFSYDPSTVPAGSEFDLNMTFQNTNSVKNVKNIKVFLAAPSGGTTGTTASVFTPVDSSNTFYIDSISTKGEYDKTLRFYCIPDAQPMNHVLAINFEYEDNEGNKYTATETIGINVTQPTKVDVSEFFIPTDAMAYTPVNVFFEIYNLSKIQVSNLMVRLEGDFESEQKTTFFGNMESGSSNYYDCMFTPMMPGFQEGSFVISYEDSTGALIEVVKPFSINVMDMMIDTGDIGWEEPGGDFSGEIEGEGGKFPWVLVLCIAGGLVIAGVVVVLVVVKRRKHLELLKALEQDEEMGDNE